ncbi:MAG: UPF0175 family protein [Ignavibacteriales bacterium]|nr:UPF0175 family protein [Ignavibacteriales bacterium]
MNIQISNDILRLTNLSEQEINLEIALMLFERNKLTLGQASKLAGLHQFEFQKILASRNIPLHYDSSALATDLRNLGIA